jgi:hypothetical protein
MGVANLEAYEKGKRTSTISNTAITNICAVYMAGDTLGLVLDSEPMAKRAIEDHGGLGYDMGLPLHGQ